MPTINQTHDYDASPETIFAHLTDTKLLDTWWTTSNVSEPRKGGRFEYRFDVTAAAKEDGKEDHAERGTYTAFEPGRALAYPWNSHAPTNVRFDFEKQGKGTRLRLSHTDLPEAMVEPISQGWQFFLGNLRSVLAGGPDQRGAMGLKIDVRA